MHRLGLFHADLNLKNILVRREAHGIQSYVIDLDRAKLFPREVPGKKAQKNLQRLLRSVRKLDPVRRQFPVEDWELFVRYYAEAGRR
jgi:tRNA A-37 threonylcarbamoyl transferase component Bud32